MKRYHLFGVSTCMSNLKKKKVTEMTILDSKFFFGAVNNINRQLKKCICGVLVELKKNNYLKNLLTTKKSLGTRFSHIMCKNPYNNTVFTFGRNSKFKNYTLSPKK